MARKNNLKMETVKPSARQALLDAAQKVLGSDGFADLSTRKVAAAASVPLSQIHYHFGSKQGLMLALFEHRNEALLDRQHRMFGDPALTLSEQWKRACDYLDEDLASGYVRVLNELAAAGWSDPVIGKTVREALAGWRALLTDVSRRAESRFGGFGLFTPEDVAALVVSVFLGAEMNVLSGIDNPKVPIRAALRKIGTLIELMEKQSNDGR